MRLLYLYLYRYRTVRMYKYERSVNSNKEKLHYVNFISNLIYCLNNICYVQNDIFVTVHKECSKIPPSNAVNFASSVQKSRVFPLSSP